MCLELDRNFNKMMAFKTDRTKCGTETMETTKCKDKDLHRKLTQKIFLVLLCD